MKRSEINRALRDMESMLERYRFALPPFCHYTPEDWQTKGHDHDEIRDNMLGWDITDYGLGDFNRVGFSLITLRNGNLSLPGKYAKTYAEKLLFLKEGQYSPNHFHWHKMEDIINRGGGTLLMVWMTAICGLEQRTAQGINLLYFLPTAVCALIFHIKNRLIRWDVVLPAALAGAAAAALTAWLGLRLDTGILRKIFGGFLLLVGLKELFGRYPRDKKDR